MKITRMDLDMAGSPAGLVTKVLAAEPILPLVTPVEELARCFDIKDIVELETEGFEGGLLTNEERTDGVILVNKNCGPTRRRFTISHELGHYLISSHKPVLPDKFLCKREDMRQWDTKHQNRYARMEAEANQLAALLLIPPPRLRLVMREFRQPDITDILAIAEKFQVSKEAAARSYVEHHDETLAVIFVKDGVVLRAYSGRDFPFVTAPYRKRIPAGSNFSEVTKSIGIMQECEAGAWFDKAGATVQEQVHLQRDGYAMILLWTDIPEEEDEDENRTSSERFRARQDRYSR